VTWRSFPIRQDSHKSAAEGGIVGEELRKNRDSLMLARTLCEYPDVRG
jgi:hypothetical protein